jgi:hypothetical protein
MEDETYYEEYEDDTFTWSKADADLERWLAGEDLSVDFEDDGTIALTKEEYDGDELE